MTKREKRLEIAIHEALDCPETMGVHCIDLLIEALGPEGEARLQEKRAAEAGE